MLEEFDKGYQAFIDGIGRENPNAHSTDNWFSWESGYEEAAQ